VCGNLVDLFNTPATTNRPYWQAKDGDFAIGSVGTYLQNAEARDPKHFCTRRIEQPTLGKGKDAHPEFSGSLSRFEYRGWVDTVKLRHASFKV
jgi:hypothetical protein